MRFLQHQNDNAMLLGVDLDAVSRWDPDKITEDVIFPIKHHIKTYELLNKL